MANMSTTLAPFLDYCLLRHDTTWRWGVAEKSAFVASKEQFLSNQVLIHYDPKMELVVACDASAYGVGVVLSHRLPDRTERPIGFVSRTLSDAEKKYSQIEKEGLACVFGVTKFHEYVHGRHFRLITDHKPLQSLFDGKYPISSQASGRIKRWALSSACRSMISNVAQHINMGTQMPLAGYHYQTHLQQFQFQPRMFFSWNIWSLLQSQQHRSRIGHSKILSSHRCCVASNKDGQIK